VRIKDEAIIAGSSYRTGISRIGFLPDKAIDLIDESAAKLRLEMNSQPEELDRLERMIRQLEIEREAIKRENDVEKLRELSAEIGNLSVQRDTLKAKWQQERGWWKKCRMPNRRSSGSSWRRRRLSGKAIWPGG